MDPTQFPSDDGSGAPALVAAASAALIAPDGDFGILGDGGLAICVVDARSPDLPILFANRAFLDMSGYEASEVLGRNCRFLQGPETDPRDVAHFRECMGRGRPFQATITNHRKTGEAFRNEIFVSPVRDEHGETARYIGILVESPVQDDSSEGRAIAALRHQFRNQIQTMTSLVSLLGQRLPPGEGRSAFEDLRARFEAINVLQGEGAAPVGAMPSGRLLTALAERVVGLFDPGMLHRVEVAVPPFQASPRRTAALAQILAELMIDLFRNGLGDDAPRAAHVSVSCSQTGEIRIESHLASAKAEEPLGASGGLGVVILENLVRALGGSIVRRRGEGLDCEIVVPPETARR